VLVLRSRWILPIADRPLLNGWIALDHGRVAAVGRAGASLPFRDDAPLVDLGEMAVMPALVNAHTHLELSWMAGRIGRHSRFTDWVREMLAMRRQATPPPDVVRASIEAAIAQARASGTGLVGDISNSLATVAPLRRSHLDGVVFHELLRLRAADADDVLEQGLLAIERAGTSERVPVSLAPHAPYSVSPQLFQGIRAALTRMPFLPTSVHLGESPEEVELLGTGQGPWRRLLEDLGAWDPAWQPPGCGPVEYLDRMKLLGPRTLAVHGVQCGVDDLARLAETGATLVTCPRSNQYVGVGAPPVERFYRSGVRVAVGTDSLASADDLNVFSELAALRALAPSVPAASLLASATAEGARALGFDADFGAIEPGRRAALIAVDLPSQVVDVEQYLVGGIVPSAVHWVNDLLGERASYAN
jgi:cytosine/adenosine deaminase-related metal-dependent hydrolase